MKLNLAICLAEALLATPATAQTTLTGCLARQFRDVQDIDNYTLQIWLNVAGRTERFNFQPNRVEMIAPTGTPLTTLEQAMKYDMISRWRVWRDAGSRWTTSPRRGAYSASPSNGPSRRVAELVNSGS